MSFASALVGGALGLGGSLLGGYLQKRGSDKASNAQAGAADRAADLQYQTFLNQQALLAPWVQSGGGNLNRLNYAMYGQLPTANQMQLDPNSIAYANYVDQNPEFARQLDEDPDFSGALYQNPVTGEITTEAPQLAAGQMGVTGGSLSPDYRYSYGDWEASPEYQVYGNARDTAIRQAQEQINARSAAGGMYGSGTWANQLAKNIGDTYALYDPQSYAAAQQAALGQRQTAYNMLAGMASPEGAQQVAGYAGQYGANAGNLMTAAGNAQASGYLGSANALGNAIQGGLGQISNIYGQYQGQKNFDALLKAFNARV